MGKFRVFKNIDVGDKGIYKFITHKEFGDITETIYSGSGYGIYRGIYQMPNQYINNVIPISASNIQTEPTNSDGSYQKITYQSVFHNFYREERRGYDHPNIVRHLFATASIFSIPQIKVGDYVNHKSFWLNDYSPSGSGDVTLIDDGFGNICDTSINSSSFASTGSLVGYWGFNEKYNYIGTKRANDTLSFGFANHINHINPFGASEVTAKNILYSRGIYTTGDYIVQSGVKAGFEGDGYITIKDYDALQFVRNTDFAISMWLDLPVSQSDTTTTYNGIINKSQMSTGLVHTQGQLGLGTEIIERPTSKYPFEITIYNQRVDESGKVRFKISDSNTLRQITTTTPITGSEKHLLFQKSGSFMQIYIDSVLDVTGSAVFGGDMANDDHVIIGTYNTSKGYLSGSIDEVRIYDTVLSQTQITSLADNDYMTGSAYQTNVVGNIFYKDGIAVISDYRPKYDNVLLGQTGQYDYTGGYGFFFKHQSTLPITEYEVVCKLREDEYNMTLNPTIKKYSSRNSTHIASWATSSYFNPYITSIGLYNDKYELVAIGKLSSPLPKRSDIPTNIIVKFDI